ncbi:MAG: rluD [Gammaproteobacteria bacterium]|jgi:23S rRNA pseudouridine1911/1915/1917 synthase|nr:rluD [Gammaproteobacteria bacterium]
MNTNIQLTTIIPEEISGLRLDQALAQLFPDYSRSRLQTWIKTGQVIVDGQSLRAKDKITAGQEIHINAELITETTSLPQAIQLDIVYEDDSIIVINKPVGLVVHPGTGNANNTLLNALLHRYPESANLPRAGIVHRLDKETSGIMVVARTLQAHHSLVSQLHERTVKRQYLAIVNGTLISGATIDQPIDRHPKQRTKMAVVEDGRPAITHYRISERFQAHTAIKVFLETGRTHQIRVHMAHIHHPIVGDQVYGGRLKLPPHISETCREALRSFKRQALHAKKLTLIHPCTLEEMTFAAPIPEDLVQLMEHLRAG